MAEKKIFLAGDDRFLFKENVVEYKYYGGFAFSQRQKCVISLHESVKRKYPEQNILEISTKSTDELGVSLSAFNLLYSYEKIEHPVPVECIFQSAKCFENGGPYEDLLLVKPKDAKRDPRLRESGKLTSFQFDGKTWPLIPTTLFYDWIYINAIYQNEELSRAITNFDIFTDIEFNHKKSINCQARSAAIYRTLQKRKILDDVIRGDIELASLYIPHNR